MAELNPYVGALFNLANTFATPLAKSLVEDKQPTQSTSQVANATVNEIAQNARLNGSGPADPTMAVQSAPTTLQGFISGEGTDRQQETKQGFNIMWLVIAGLGALLIFLVARKA